MLSRLLTPLVLVSLVSSSTAQEEADRPTTVLRAEEVTLAPSPWSVGDFLEYEVRDSKGHVIGMLYSWVEAVEGDEGSVRLWTRRFHGVDDQIVGSVQIAMDTMRPAVSELHPGPGKLLFTTYGESEAIVDAAGESRPHALEEACYDAQSLVQLVRRLPLEVGTRLRLPVFDPVAGPTNVRFDVDEERIRWGQDKVDCFVVTTSTGLTFWITQDEARLPVWVQQDKDFRAILNAMRAPDEPRGNFDSGPLAFDLQAPAGWVLGQPNKAKDGRLAGTAVCLREPASVFFEVVALEEDDGRDVTNFTNRSRSRAKKRYRGYRPRRDSWEETTVDGHPALTFTADYREQGERGWVQRRSLIRSDRLLAEFVYRAPEEEYERQVGALKAIVESFRQRALPVPPGD